MPDATPVTGRTLPDSTRVELSAGPARWFADLAPSLGGAGTDPTPHQLLDSSLAACTMLTLQLYARRKNYPLVEVSVTISHDEGGGVYRMRRHITVSGELSDEQTTDLLRAANSCPIHKVLTSRFEIDTSLEAAGEA